MRKPLHRKDLHPLVELRSIGTNHMNVYMHKLTHEYKLTYYKMQFRNQLLLSQ